MATLTSRQMLSSLCLLLSLIQLTDAKNPLEKLYMDKMCGNDHFVLDGDTAPGVSFQLTSSSKYKSNMNCTVKFRASQPSQRIIVTVEKMTITDCPGDLLRIYDGPTLLNPDTKQQCGSPSLYTFTSASTQVSMTFTSNSAIESNGFQMAIALGFPMVTSCPQQLGFFYCKNKNCISKQLQCDGRNHCGDGTEENQCSLLAG